MVCIRQPALLAGAFESRLAPVDWAIIAAFIVVSLAIGIVLSKRARRSTKEYFTSGGALPWWLLGTSMVATTFAADTPLALSGWVVTKGISQNWFWWCQVPITLAGVYFFARLWKRTQVLTDMEFVYLRYSGRSADALRGFKALYFALPYGCIIMGWVNKAMAKIISLTIPVFPPIPGVDAALEWLYLHTPLSSAMNPAIKAAIGRGLIDPHSLYRRAQELGGNVGPEDLVRLAGYVKAGVAAPTLAEQFHLSEFAWNCQPTSDTLAAIGSGIAADGLHVTRAALEAVDPLTLIQNVATFVQGVHELKILFFLFLVTILYTMISGLWGVVVTDFMQFWIAMFGTVLLAVLAVRSVGGMGDLFARLQDIYGATRARGMVSITPIREAGGVNLMPLSELWIYLLLAWWTVGFTDGGSYFSQRMLSARNERHAALGYLWYAVAHYTLRMWPWLVVGMAAAVMFPYLNDPVTGALPGSDIAENGYIKVMIAVLPAGLLGLLVASFFAAYMSTISTQVNLAAAYLLNDFYRPFVRPGADEKHYVRMGMAANILIALVGIVVSLYLSSIVDAWLLIASLNSGIGLIYLLRWYWWRVNAWTEIACIAMLMYLYVIFRFFHVNFGMPALTYPNNLLLTVPISFSFAILVTLMTKPVEREKLKAFYRRVQPGGPGWKDIEDDIRRETPDFRAKTPLTRDNLRVFLMSVATIYCFLFGIGKTVIGDALYPNPVFHLGHVGLGCAALGVFFIVFGWPAGLGRALGLTDSPRLAGWLSGGLAAGGLALVILAPALGLDAVGLHNRAFGILLIVLGLGLGWVVAMSFSEKKWQE
ncbi:MAG: hypothetical protein Kow0059_05320 [Candidatus Sumerlaeia bacterium]